MAQESAPTKPILFFDGICHLCNGFVDELLQRDRTKQYLFAPLQGTTAQTLLPSEERENMQSLILLDGSKKYLRSEAVLKVLTSLGGFYKLFLFAYLIPRSLRDWLYSWVARHRYSWFGTRDVCRIPTAEDRDRLLN